MNGWLWLRIAAILGFLSVAFGAFGAHSLKSSLEVRETDSFETRARKQRSIENFETAARYQMYHAVALAIVGLAAVSRQGGGWLNAAGWAFLVGTLLFSGSLYAWVLTGQRWLVALTPIGGVVLMVGWLALAIGVGGLAKPDSAP
jgi:uncharacterized membrane protein YgdD (TMEM256/DUF423 family)